MLTQRDATVLRIAVRCGFVTEEQVQRALEDAPPGIPLEVALEERGLITRAERDRILLELADSGERRRAAAELPDLERRLRELETARLAEAAHGEKRLGPENIRIQGLRCRGFEFGPYEILDEIARGGMGVLYRARQVRSFAADPTLKLPAEVALKVIVARQASALGAAADVERFIREIRTLVTLVHPNIVRIFDAGRENGLHYYSMELVRGDSLRDFVRLRPPPLLFALDITRKIASALGAMHAAGALHCDVKPANVLIDRAASPFRPVLIDFGLIRGKFAGRYSAGRGEVAGTPAYMAPEQTDPSGAHGAVGPATDLYALGATLYFCLAGRPAFLGSKPETVIAQVRNERPKPLTAFVPDLPPSVDSIVLRLLEKRPEHRYQSAEALAAALDHEIERARRSLRRENLYRKLQRKFFGR